MRRKILSFIIAVAITAGVALTSAPGVRATAEEQISAAAFFETNSGNLAVTETAEGLKLDVSGAGATATIKYKDAFPVSGLGEIIKMRVLPLTAGKLDFNAVQFTVRDSENTDQVVSVMIGKSNVWYGSKSTGGVVAFTDRLTYSGTDGYVSVTGTSQNAIGLDHWQCTGYTSRGNFHLAEGYTPDVNAWGTYYPLLAAPDNETATMTLRYDSDGCIRLNNGKQDRNLAFINGRSYTNNDKTTDFYSASTEKLDDTDPAQAELKARYTTEYYENLFSSGKVTFEMKFIEIQNDRVSVVLSSLFGTKMLNSWEQNYTSPVLTGGLESGEETGSEEVEGSRIPLATNVVLPGTISVAELKNGVTFQVLPSQVGENWKSAQYIQVIFRDSENADKLISVFIRNANWWGSNNPSAVCALVDTPVGIAGDGGTKIGKTSCFVVGYDGHAEAKYNTHGYWIENAGKGRSQVFEQETTRSLTVEYDNETKAVYCKGGRNKNNYVIARFADLADGATATQKEQNFFYQSTKDFYNTAGDAASGLKNVEDQSIVDKYNTAWTNNLFSSGKVSVEFRFYNISGDGKPDYNTVNTAAGLKIISLGGVSAAQLSDKGEFADTIAPEVVATESIELEKGKAYETADILALVSASADDNIDGEITPVKKLYNATDEEKSGEVTPAADWYVGSIATDAAGNSSTLAKTAIAFVDYYDVKFYNGDGSLMKTDHVRSGSAATAPTETPVKAGTTEKDYSFSGWDKTFDNVTANLDVYPTFTETAKQYFITFLNYDGNELSKVKVPYGTVPAFDGTPTKPSDETHDYAFIGWEPALTAVTGEATYTAQFRTVDKLLVRFFNGDGSVMKSEYVSVGGTAVAPTETPTKESTAQYDFVFSAWDKSLENITESCDVNATFTETLRKYEIVFKAENGDELYKAEFEYGTLPVYGGETPVKEPSGGYSYAFDGWTADLVEVTGKAEYTVKFRAIEVEYTVTFVVNGGDEIAVASRTIFAAYTLPVATREGYVFKGWYDNAQLGGEAVSEIAAGIANEGDKTFYAKWEEIPAAAPEKKGCGKQTARDIAIMLGSLSAILAAALFVGKKG